MFRAPMAYARPSRLATIAHFLTGSSDHLKESSDSAPGRGFHAKLASSNVTGGDPEPIEPDIVQIILIVLHLA